MTGGVNSKVILGAYAGFTRAEVQAEFARYKAELQQSGSRLLGSSLGGQTFQFGPRSDWTLAEWNRQLLYALSQVDPDYIAPTSQIVVRFGGGCS